MSLAQPRNRRIFLKPYLDFPDLRSLPIRIAATALENAVSEVCGELIFTPDQLDTLDRCVNRSKFPHLSDDLMPYLRPSRSGVVEKIVRRTAAELQAFRELDDEFRFSSPLNFDDFVGWLQDIHHAVTGLRSDFRRGGMRTRPDGENNTIIFPPASRIPALLAAHQIQGAGRSPMFPAMAAVTAYVGLIHCHPFADGNGRTARVMLNLLLSRVASAPVFIPYSYWSYLHGGAFILKVRRAMYSGEWQPLLLFFADTLRLLAGTDQRPKIETQQVHRWKGEQHESAYRK